MINEIITAKAHIEDILTKKGNLDQPVDILNASYL